MVVVVRDLETARDNARKAAAVLQGVSAATEGGDGTSASPPPTPAASVRTTLAALIPEAPPGLVPPHVAAAADVTVEIFYNLTLPEVQQHELDRGEAVRAANGAMVVRTGAYTGRSPKDRFIVDRAGGFAQHIDWGEVNQPISPSNNDALFELVTAGLAGKHLFVFDGYVGASTISGRRVRVITCDAYLHHFCINMLIPPAALGEPEPTLDAFDPEYTVLSASCVTDEAGWRQHGLHSAAFITMDFDRRLTLIGGTKYSGEIKKGLFACLNAWLPQEGRLSMHCAATTNQTGTDSVLFFGLSGTGKTTLSSDPSRKLIGDDEHAWFDFGVYNLEWGCYCKTLGLTEAREPDLYHAIKDGSILENVVLDSKGNPVYSDASLTPNGRASYPMHFVPAHEPSRRGPHPHAIIFLTSDAFGVFPAVSRLSPEQASYHFLSGYTAKVAGTERGIVEPVPTFSHCYGAAFMPLRPGVYGDLLAKKMREHNTDVYLLNTGWTGGGPGVGHRFPLAVTRALVTAIVTGAMAKATLAPADPIFRLRSPVVVPGAAGEAIPAGVLDPKAAWVANGKGDEYDAVARRVAGLFVKNWTERGFSAELAEYGPVGEEA